jgi:hypothetical protein
MRRSKICGDRAAIERIGRLRCDEGDDFRFGLRAVHLRENIRVEQPARHANCVVASFEEAMASARHCERSEAI